MHDAGNGTVTSLLIDKFGSSECVSENGKNTLEIKQRILAGNWWANFGRHGNWHILQA
jgi:hypothetical protein